MVSSSALPLVARVHGWCAGSFEWDRHGRLLRRWWKDRGVGGSEQEKVRERRKNRDEGAAATGVYLYHIRLCVFMYYGRHGTGLPCDWVYFCTIVFMYVGVPALLFAIFYVVSRRERSQNEIL